MFQGYRSRFKEARRKNVSCRAFKIPPLSPPQVPHPVPSRRGELGFASSEAGGFVRYLASVLPILHPSLSSRHDREWEEEGEMSARHGLFLCWLMAVRLRWIESLIEHGFEGLVGRWNEDWGRLSCLSD